VNDPSIYYVDGDNRLSLPPDNRKCVENLCFFQSGSVILFFMPENLLLSSAKQTFKL